MIKDFEIYESVELNDKYLIGLPSGQIIDIEYKQINNLKQDGLIVYDKKWKSYVFKDDDFNEILRKLNKIELNKSSMDEIVQFFNNRKHVRNYTITRDGIDVSGSIYISGRDYEFIPFKFNKVTGDFIFKDCKLESLKNAPLEVGGDFIISNNNLFKLLYGPAYVGKNYDCSGNCINTLVGSPNKIFGDFNCSDNFLLNLTGGPKIVNGFYDCSDNPIKTMNGEPEKCGKMITRSDKIKKYTKFRDEGDAKYSW